MKVIYTRLLQPELPQHDLVRGWLQSEIAGLQQSGDPSEKLTEGLREYDLHVFIPPVEDYLSNPAAGPWVKVETDMIARAVISQRYPTRIDLGWVHCALGPCSAWDGVTIACKPGQCARPRLPICRCVFERQKRKSVDVTPAIVVFAIMPLVKLAV